MITINKNFEIHQEGDLLPPYNYEVIAENQSSCIMINNPTGTTNRFVNLSLTFSNQECLDNAEVFLRVFSKSGCSTTIPVALDNVCSSIMADITNLGNNTYFANVVNGSPLYTYSWSYDTTIYNADNTDNQTIQLTFKEGITNPPESSQLFLTVTDSKGCFVDVVYNITICKPTVKDYIVNAICNPSNLSRTANICILPNLCPGQKVSWSNSVFNVPQNIQYNIDEFCGQGRKLNLQIPNSFESGSFTITYYLEVDSGLVSNIGTITVIVPICTNDPDIISEQKPPFEIDCNSKAGDIFVIPQQGSLEDCVTSSTPVDWNTFEFTTGTLSNNNKTTTTALGALVNYNEINKTIEYTIPQTSGSDAFSWIVCNESGNCTQNTSYAVILECQQDPVTNSDNYCAVCGTNTVFNITQNDVINGSINSIQITQQPQHGTATVNQSNNTISYSANNNYHGSDSLKYTVTNNNNLTSNESEVTITVICTGTSSNIFVCR